MYRELKKNGNLQKFVEAQAELLLETYRSQLVDVHQPVDQNPKAGYLEQLSAIIHAESHLTEQTLAQVLNYRDLPTTSLPQAEDKKTAF